MRRECALVPLAGVCRICGATTDDAALKGCGFIEATLCGNCAAQKFTFMMMVSERGGLIHGSLNLTRPEVIAELELRSGIRLRREVPPWTN